MKVKAKISFAGRLTMYKGEVLECSDDAVLQDLLSCGYIELVEPVAKCDEGIEGDQETACDEATACGDELSGGDIATAKPMETARKRGDEGESKRSTSKKSG